MRASLSSYQNHAEIKQDLYPTGEFSSMRFIFPPYYKCLWFISTEAHFSRSESAGLKVRMREQSEGQVQPLTAGYRETDGRAVRKAAPLVLWLVIWRNVSLLRSASWHRSHHSDTRPPTCCTVPWYPTYLLFDSNTVKFDKW